MPDPNDLDVMSLNVCIRNGSASGLSASQKIANLTKLARSSLRNRQTYVCLKRCWDKSGFFIDQSGSTAIAQKAFRYARYLVPIYDVGQGSS